MRVVACGALNLVVEKGKNIVKTPRMNDVAVRAGVLFRLMIPLNAYGMVV